MSLRCRTRGRDCEDPATSQVRLCRGGVMLAQLAQEQANNALDIAAGVAPVSDFDALDRRDPHTPGCVRKQHSVPSPDFTGLDLACDDEAAAGETERSVD